MRLMLSADRHYLSVSDLLAAGFSHYRINKLVSEGKLVKLNRQIYENTSYNGEMTDFSVVSAYAPRGILCMMTAARYYMLTNTLPDAVDIAIGRSMKISTLPEWPSVHVWYFPEKRYQTGITTITDAAGVYRIYDIEKTVIDLLYYRNKIGIEEISEVLKNYLASSGRDLVRLHSYADMLGCGEILRRYLEVLL